MRIERAKILFAAAISMLLFSCGGESGSSAANSTVPQATISGANAISITGVVVSGSSAGAATVGYATGAIQNNSSTINAVHVANTLVDKVMQLPVVTNASPAVGAIVTSSITLPGSVSGSVTLSSSRDSVTKLGSISVTFNALTDAYSTINGTLTLQVTAVDDPLKLFPVTTAATLSFSSLAFTDASGTGTLSGSIGFAVVLNADTTKQKTMTMNFAITDPSGVRVAMENFVFDAKVNALNGMINLAYSGRFSHSVMGYVDISTTTPMVFAAPADQYPSSGGPVILQGANSTQVKVTPQSATTVLIEADTTGDTVFDWSSGAILWTSL